MFQHTMAEGGNENQDGSNTVLMENNFIVQGKTCKVKLTNLGIEFDPQLKTKLRYIKIRVCWNHE